MVAGEVAVTLKRREVSVFDHYDQGMIKKEETKLRLYHGTSEVAAKTACVKGLMPYEIPAYDSGLPRNFSAFSGATALTNSYPGLMALNYAGAKEKWGFIEIDVSQLHHEAFLPHENYLIEINKNKVISEEDRLQKLDEIRKNLQSFRRKWRDSLDRYGFCQYEAVIPISAIKKVVVYDPHSNWLMTKALLAMHPGSKLSNSCMERNRLVIRWLFGANITAEEWIGPVFNQLKHSERNPIVQMLQNKNGLDVFYHGAQPTGRRSAW